MVRAFAAPKNTALLEDVKEIEISRSFDRRPQCHSTASRTFFRETRMQTIEAKLSDHLIRMLAGFQNEIEDLSLVQRHSDERVYANADIR